LQHCILYMYYCLSDVLVVNDPCIYGIPLHSVVSFCLDSRFSAARRIEIELVCLPSSLNHSLATILLTTH
jgi:hypothetical protein